MKLKIPTLLKDTLFNSSQECTGNASFDSIRKLTPNQVYGRGIVVGAVGMLMAHDIDFRDALKTVKDHCPEDFDPACMPECWK